MATRTKPLVSAATLASAAAIAVAGTAIAPSLNLPTPNALSAAKVQLATFADVMSVPAYEWTDLLFGTSNWGGVLNSDNYGDESAKPQDVFLQPGYVNPWAVYCDGTCYRSGITGAAYLFFDALVNGNNLGYDNSDEWNTGIVNYFWEPNATFVIGGGNSPSLQYVSAGWSAATWYLLQTTIGKAVPALTVPIALPFWGPDNFSVFYNAVLSVVAVTLKQIPLVGPITGNSILAYLGDLPIPESPGLTYPYGLSGVLNYWIDIATGSAPFPTAAAATLAAAAVAPAAEAASEKAAEVSAAADTTPGADVEESTPVAESPESTEDKDSASTEVESAEAPEAAEVEAPESTPAVTETKPVVETPEVEAPEVEAPAVEVPEVEAPEAAPEVEAPESTPAVTETKPVVDAPEIKDTSVADAVDSAPAPVKAAPKRPVRDAVEKVTKSITSAINDAKAAKAAKTAKAGAADSAS